MYKNCGVTRTVLAGAQQRANGIRLSTDSFPTYPSTGEENHLRLLKP